MGLTVANYVLQPFFPGECRAPTLAAQLIAAALICFLTFINCYDVKSVTKMQNVFMFTKISALVIVIIIGISWMGMGKRVLIVLYTIFSLNLH